MKRDTSRFDDLFHDFGRINVRRMFGGEGIYAGEQIIGLVVDDRLYLKTTDSNRADYLVEGCKPFTFPAGQEDHRHVLLCRAGAAVGRPGRVCDMGSKSACRRASTKTSAQETALIHVWRKTGSRFS
jgi:DNA transformation protein